MNITKSDIGRKVTDRTGQSYTIGVVTNLARSATCWSTWNLDGSYISPTISHEMDLVSFDTSSMTLPNEYTVKYTSPYDNPTSWMPSSEGDSVDPVHCTHTWVGSGFPGGDVWCKHCDLTYNEQMHGDSGL